MAAYERYLFPQLGTSTAQTKWWTFCNVTRVTLWVHDHFQNNVRLFMVMEALDLGPTYYCVMRTFNPHFSGRLFLPTPISSSSEDICLPLLWFTFQRSL